MIFRLFHAALCWFVRRFYGIEVTGEEHLPTSGPALIVSNHVSYIDVVIITAALKRPVRFMMWRRLYETWGLRHIGRLYKALPISREDDPRTMRKSLDAAIEALKQGDLVGVFPEGSMTRTAHLQPFMRGFELIARRAKAPIIPVHLDRLWGSIFSFKEGRYFFKIPKLFGHPVRVTLGAPLPPDTDRETVRQAIVNLEADAYDNRKRTQRPLHASFMRNAMRAWWWPCLSDSTGIRLTWGGALTRALVYARWIREHCSEEKMVGIMMPPSVATALVNVAVLMAGKTLVNLNYHTTIRMNDQIIKRCCLRTIITTRRLITHVGFPDRKQFVYYDDLVRAIPRRRYLRYGLLAYVTPPRLAERTLIHRAKMDDTAAVMFTSGATGLPKGVVLTHHNIATNIESVSDALRIGWRDTIAGVLPAYHAFGFTTTIWLPFVSRIRAVYHANPLDARGVGRLVQTAGASIIVGTPSFFALYTRRCRPEQFKSLRLAVSGGQKLDEHIREAFDQCFHLELQEGYGCTELSPMVAVNVPDVRLRQYHQVTARKGSVGRPLPGIVVRIVHPETHEPMPLGADGLVLIRSASVMQGYLDDPHGTSLAIRKGWYYTRDIGALDEEGFLYIHDRMTRFSKIAGETVQHVVVERALQAADPDSNRRYLAISLPHPSRGECLAVLYEGSRFKPSPLIRTLIHSELPNLWIPAAKDFTHVESLPLMPNGYPDFIAARRLVLAGKSAGAPPENTEDRHEG